MSVSTQIRPGWGDGSNIWFNLQQSATWGSMSATEFSLATQFGGLQVTFNGFGFTPFGIAGLVNTVRISASNGASLTVDFGASSVPLGDLYSAPVTRTVPHVGSQINLSTVFDAVNHYSGGSLRDNVSLGKGNDTALGLAGDDYLNGGEGADLLDGGADTDNVSGDAGDDTLEGGGGDDLLSGGEGHDILRGGDGADTLDGGEGYNQMFGGAGDDLVVFIGQSTGPGADFIDGGAGVDRLRVNTMTYNDYLFTTGDLLWEPGPRPTPTPPPGQFLDYSWMRFDGINTFTHTGNRTIQYANLEGIVVYGGMGDDTIIGSSGSDRIEGGGGGDQLYGGDGDDVINAGSRDNLFFGFWNMPITRIDSLDAVLANSDPTPIPVLPVNYLDGGTGKDILEITGDIAFPSPTLDFSGLVGPAPFVIGLGRSLMAVNFEGVHLDLHQAPFVRLGVDERGVELIDYRLTIIGSAGDDLLRGAHESDTISGGAGDDVLGGKGGSDILDGGAGRDIVEAQTQQPLGYSLPTGVDPSSPPPAPGAYMDLVVSPGWFFDGYSWDQISSIEGARGTNQRDFFSGDAQSNLFEGLGGNDVLIGRGGNDDLLGGDGADYIFGGFVDIAAGGTGDDTADGGGGDDVIYTGDGNDILRGGDGDDLLLGGVGFDQLYGGDGKDTIFVGQEWGIGNEVASNYVDGGGGGDQIWGSAGADTIYGGTGLNWIYAGGGDDTFLIGGWTPGAEGAIDYVVAGAGNDTIRMMPGSNALVSGPQNATTYGRRGSQGPVMHVLDFAAGDKIDVAYTDIVGGLQIVAGSSYIFTTNGSHLVLHKYALPASDFTS